MLRKRICNMGIFVTFSPLLLGLPYELVWVGYGISCASLYPRGVALASGLLAATGAILAMVLGAVHKQLVLEVAALTAVMIAMILLQRRTA